MIKKFFIFVLAICLLMNTVLGADIGYILKNPDNPDDNVIAAINYLGYDYELIDDNDILTTDFNDYGMILILDGPLANYEDIPVNEKKSLVMNTYYLNDWGIGEYVVTQASTGYFYGKVLVQNSITESFVSPVQIYTQREAVLYTLPYAYQRARGLENIISTDNYRKYPILGTISPGGKLYNGAYAKERIAFFGATETEAWSLESRKLFRNTVKWILEGGDRDFDGMIDEVDNCVDNSNPDQIDSDEDGIGDVCDICLFDSENDADGDGVCGNADNCPYNSNSLQEDFDEDEIGDVCDSDIDGDKINNINDLCEFSSDINVDSNGCADYQLIVINEFDSNPKGSDSGNEWVEIYNPTESNIDISGFEIWEGLSNSGKIHAVPEGEVLESYGYYVVYVNGLNNNGEFLSLYDSLGNILDETPILSDTKDDVNAWARKPNGIDTDTEQDWVFQTGTKEFDNDADTDNPILISIGNKEINENFLLEFIVRGVDLGDDLITLSAMGLPDGAEFLNIEGIGYVGQKFSWTPDYEDEGNYEVEFIVSDGELEDRETIIINVKNTNRNPVLNEIAGQILDEDDEIEVVLTGSDEDGDELFYKIINKNAKEIDCSIDNDILIIFPYLDYNGDGSCEVEVSDGELSDSKIVNINVNPVNDAPIIKNTFPDIINPKIIENTDQLFSVTAFDADSSLNILWFLDEVDLNITKDNYLFNQERGGYEVKVEVSDSEYKTDYIWNVFVGDLSEFTCEEVKGNICKQNEMCRNEDLLGVKDSNISPCCSAECSPKFKDAGRCDNLNKNINIAIKDPDSGDDFNVNDKIQVKIDIENNFNDDRDFDIEAYLYDLTEDDEIELYEDSIGVDKGKREKIEFEFKIPDDLDEKNDYAVFVKAFEDNDCNEEYIKINIDREKHDVVIESLNMESNEIECGDYIYLETKIKNKGKRDEIVYLTIENSELGINEKTPEFKIEKFDDNDEILKTFEIKTPENIEQGIYELKTTLVFEEGEDSLSENLNINCKNLIAESEEIKTVFIKGNKTEIKEKKDNPAIMVFFIGLLAVLLIIVIILKIRGL